jgi:hypothetical protein
MLMITPGGRYSLFVIRKKEIKLIFIYHQSEKYKIWQAFIFDQENKGSTFRGSGFECRNP